MKLCIFSGTSAGYELCQFVSQCGKQATVYVATKYEQQMLELLSGITVERGRLSVDAIRQRIDKKTLVIDATHPYTMQITQHLQKVCTEQGAEYLRLYGDSSDRIQKNQNDGSVLLTTGNQKLALYTEEPGYTLKEIKTILRKRWGQIHRFPLFLSLEGRHCAVFGAGKIAARRTEILRRFGAIVCVTAPESRSYLRPDNLRPYQLDDLDNIFLAVAATDNRMVNHQIGEDCQARGIFCSVADSAAESSFYFPALCESENFIAGVVSHGENHSGTAKIAAQIRDVLQHKEGK